MGIQEYLQMTTIKIFIMKLIQKEEEIAKSKMILMTMITANAQLVR